jgi:hypothetical protein
MRCTEQNAVLAAIDTDLRDVVSLAGKQREETMPCLAALGRRDEAAPALREAEAAFRRLGAAPLLGETAALGANGSLTKGAWSGNAT